MFAICLRRMYARVCITRIILPPRPPPSRKRALEYSMSFYWVWRGRCVEYFYEIWLMMIFLFVRLAIMCISLMLWPPHARTHETDEKRRWSYKILKMFCSRHTHIYIRVAFLYWNHNLVCAAAAPFELPYEKFFFSCGGGGGCLPNRICTVMAPVWAPPHTHMPMEV